MIDALVRTSGGFQHVGWEQSTATARRSKHRASRAASNQTQEMSGQDSLDNAERQMAERVVEQYHALSEKLLSRLGPDVDPATEDGRRAVESAWQAVLSEDPDAKEIAAGFAAYLGAVPHEGRTSGDEIAGGFGDRIEEVDDHPA